VAQAYAADRGEVGAALHSSWNAKMDAPGASLQAWVGREEVASDFVTAAPYAALAATLDREPLRPAPGTPLPPLWHWLYFLPAHRRSELGPDGHARRGAFLPPVPLPRRMWAGSRFAFRAPIRVGDALTRRSTIESVVEKSGRSGPLVFVTVRHELTCAGGASPALVEHHDIVYRAAPGPGEPAAAAQRAPASAAFEATWVPDDVLLFRYSALTFNGHRIHYDRRYATTVEGYPGLVVHGPLLATLLLDLLRTHRPGSQVTAFAFRAVRPVFDTAPFSVCGAPGDAPGAFRLWVRDADGLLAMDATATLA
jgi:3-methylfumaryl-CoA hydratase